MVGGERRAAAKLKNRDGNPPQLQTRKRTRAHHKLSSGLRAPGPSLHLFGLFEFGRGF